MTEKQYGIIFDMDNTLLQSRIDFGGMKRAVFEEIVSRGLCAGDLAWQDHTASQLIELARQSGKMTKEAEGVIWEAVERFEREGMREAILEPHVLDMLTDLYDYGYLIILTNNARSAAVEALTRTGIAHYFDHIAGREQMTALKPSPSGILHVLNQYLHVPEERWTFVGDSWIDGKAAQDGGIRFFLYRGDSEEMARRGVRPHVHIRHMSELGGHVRDQEGR
ncbi:phosphoglycolate phosphatase [Aneurinibacillus soli]|uniref:Phosphoglycolate phosphatase, chromosomal n=2 Tax=Aneurinibacillus soli TaxID=1500254 RepID=A0A0U5B6C0_9BACL|nr:HAD-IA family hydrolase [Aneurinibacillus soli]PYE60130.1 phosphoglycolate phosphatase [Aneurinibacillus soli]BAU26381.1 Phosphoglycolate phosphatase, chromosomal [Aneurinibacillus soli]